MQGHHIIPESLFNTIDLLKQFYKSADFNFTRDGKQNILDLPTNDKKASNLGLSLHNGGDRTHTAYTAAVGRIVREIQDNAHAALSELGLPADQLDLANSFDPSAAANPAVAAIYNKALADLTGVQNALRDGLSAQVILPGTPLGNLLANAGIALPSTATTVFFVNNGNPFRVNIIGPDLNFPRDGLSPARNPSL